MVLAEWCANRDLKTACQDLPNISERTIIEHFNNFRKLARSRYWFDITSNPLGGQNVVVEIDESQFSKAKYNRGRQLTKPQKWFFGAIDMSSSRVFIQKVQKRDAATLIPLIQLNIVQSSTIWSDQWKAYQSLQSLNYTHFEVNHSTNFVNPANGVNTQGIEGTWSQIKSFLRAKHAKRRNVGKNFQICWIEMNL